MKPDRASVIRQLLFSRGSATIAEIADVVGASEPTIRRDLRAMEASGWIARTHGGARIADDAGGEIEFELREQMDLPAKRAIGAAAHSLIRSDSAIFLDAGTTVLQLARKLRMSPIPVRVFTNCLPVAQILMPTSEISVTLLGGALRVENASTVGLLAEEALDRLWFDQLFLGVSAISADGDITTANELEARLNARVITRTDAPIVLAGAGKFGGRLTYRVARLGTAFRVLTDPRLEPDWTDRITATGAKLTLVEPV